MMDDKRIIAELQEGVEGAFQSLYEKYYKQLFTYAYSLLGTVQDAEDVVQGRFLMLMENPKVWNRVADLRPYLYKVVHNACLHYMSANENSSRKAKQYTDFVYAGEENEMPAVLKSMNDQARQHVLTPMLSKLGRQCRQAMDLVYLQNKTYAEAGKIMGISKNSIKTHLNLGKDFFRKRIDSLINLCVMVTLLRINL